ncbi:hypothetical protein [Lentzea sp. NBRC 102530]|uniref:hypothetical protein n=1 Tax=Lentzea sp. NBRC 102530 TaxID=3032201 RepID=UPI002554198A|nr:hypothetical protein [Lentzea sp. NBRC 102530]
MVDELGRELRSLLAKMSGYSIEDSDYVSYFVNEYGERLVFVRRPKKTAVLLHSDLGWEPKEIAGPPASGGANKELPPEVRRFLNDVPVVGDIILNHPEALWLKACLAATD